MISLESIVFRKATMNDLPQMIKVMDEALESPTLDQEMDERVQSWSTKLNDHSRLIFYVAEVNPGKVIGWCRGGKALEVHSMVAGEEYDCEIHNFFVLPAYQHCGIGRQLWQILWNDILRTFHPKNMVVWSVETERTQKIYTLLGGVRQEQRKFSDDHTSTAFVWHDLIQIEGQLNQS